MLKSQVIMSMEVIGDMPESAEKPFAGKIVVITGASRDLGAEIATGLARQGGIIVGGYRNKFNKANIVEERLVGLGQPFELVAGDLRTDDGIKDFVSAADRVATSVNGTGQIDMLILNAASDEWELNLDANNRLIDEFLPKMQRGGKIVLMQSNGHYIRTVGSVGLIPDFYVKVAESKDEAERSIEARLPEFEEHGIALVRFIAPAVKGSHNIRILEGKYGYAHEQFLRLGEKLGLRGYISLPEIGDTVVKVLSRNTGPDYIELFGPYLDGCHILQSIYGQEAIYIDTKNTETHTGTMVVNYERAGKQNEIVVTPISRTGQNAIAQLQVKNEHAIGHFNEQMGLSILAGHKRIRAAVETMAQFSDQPGIKMKLRGFECVRFPGIARPGDIVTIDATLINHVGNIYTVNVRLSVNGKICTEIEGLKTEAVAGNSRDTLVEDQLIEYAVQSAAVDIFANDSHKMPLFVGIGRASFSGIELTPGVSVTARDHDGKQIGKRGFSVSSEIIDDKGNHVAELFDMEGVLVPSSWAKRI